MRRERWAQVIGEGYKDGIALICMCLCIVLIMSAIFIPPQTIETAKSAEPEAQVLNKDRITEINIQIDNADWRWILENAAKEEYRSADVTINGETFYNVGLRAKGNSSLTSVASDPNTDRFSLKIDFGQYMEGQTYHGTEKLALNNMMSDATYMKEYLSYEIFDFLGVPTPDYSYSNIKINGKDWGLYLAVETIDANFIEKQFGSLEGNLYKPESTGIGEGMPIGGMRNMPMPQQNRSQTEKRSPGLNFPFGNGSAGGADLKYIDDKASSYKAIREGAVFKTTTDADFEKVIEMLENLNKGANLEKYLNVEGVLKYFAVNTFLVNLDSYSGGMYHNYYLYEKNGTFSIIPWDLNMSFAGFSMTMGVGEGGAEKAVNFPIDAPVTGKLEDAPLIAKLLEVDRYKELYHNYLIQLVDECINKGVLENSIGEIDMLIGKYVESDPTAFYTYEEYEKAILELGNFVRDRALSVKAQLSGEQPSASYGSIETQVNLTTLGTMQMGGQRLGEGGELPPLEEMPPLENMMEIIGILREADLDNLTAEQKEKLKSLGVDDNMIEFFKNMPQGGMPLMNNAAMGGAAPSFGMISFAAQGILAAAALLVGLLFVSKYKRKTFTAG